MASPELRLAVVSLTFQVFAGVIHEYQLICDARGMPSDLQYLRVRLKTEQYRLLDWADVVQLDVNDDSLLIGNSSKGLLLDVLDQQRRLLGAFGRLSNKYKKLARPLLVEDTEPNPTIPVPPQPGNEATLPPAVTTPVPSEPDKPAIAEATSSKVDTSWSKVSSEAQVRFPRSEYLMRKSLKWASTFYVAPRRLRWVMANKLALENLISKLSAFNDFMREMLNSAQLKNLAIKQTHTEFQIMQLNNSIERLVQIFKSTTIGNPKSRKRSLGNPTNPLWAFMQARGLSDIDEVEATELYFTKLEALFQPTLPSGAIEESLHNILQDDGKLSLTSIFGESDTQTLAPTTAEFHKDITLDNVLEGTDDTVEIEILDEDLELDKSPPIISSSHMLPERSDRISHDSWRELLPLLPEALRWGLKYEEHYGTACWTFSPNPVLAPASIPLTIAKLPVIIPVAYKYPIRAPSATLPDPYPFNIDPTVMITDQVIDEIFNTFGGIIGFYLLINGQLQLLTLEDFDLEIALARNPTKFGGLRISYVPFSILSTGTGAEGPTRATTSTSISTTQAGPSAPTPSTISERTVAWAQSTAAGPSSSKALGPPHKLDFTNTLRARVRKQRSPSWFGGKPGVLTRCESKSFITVSTHVATQALEEAKHKFQPGNRWTDKVEIYHGNYKVGDITETYDNYVNVKFPDGIEHDVSLIDVTEKNEVIVSGLKAPRDTRWLSKEEWVSMRLANSSVSLLQNHSMRSRTIAMSESREQLVGQGIFQAIQDSRTRLQAWNARRRGESASEEISKWSSFVSRAILYRVDPDFEEPRSNSGTAICLIDEETEVRKVAGFQSFVQEVSGGQYYEMEDDPFLDMLRLGAVAFYGAFQVPDKLRDEHVITTEE